MAGGSRLWEWLLGVIDPILLVDSDFDLDLLKSSPKENKTPVTGKLLIDRFEKVDAPRITIHRAVETGPSTINGLL